MDEDEKTEDPSGKRLDEAREKGQNPKSQDLLQAATLLAGVLALHATAGMMHENLREVMIRAFRAIPTWKMSDATFATDFAWGLGQLAKLILPILLPIALTGVVASVVMVGLNWTLKVFDVSNFFNLFNPGNITRMFNKKAMVELLKGVAKILVVGWIAWLSIHKSLPQFLGMAAWPFLEQVIFTMTVAYNAVFKMAVVLLLIGIADFFWQKHTHLKQLKMTKQEVKDEARQSDGDPQVKNKRRKMRNEMHKRFALRQVPQATVVITNPTHFSVALRFEKGKDIAPVMLAKGADLMAFKIREIAREASVPIVENPPVARAIYAQVEPGEQIPPELYSAVAEVLAFVLRAR